MFFLNFGNTDSRSLGGCYKLGQICGVTPFYNFEKFSNSYQNVKNVQSVLYITLGIIGTVEGVYYRYFYFVETLSPVYAIVNYLKEFFLVLAVFSAIINASFCNQKKWSKLNNYLQYTDKIFKNQAAKTDKISTNILFFVYMSIYGIYFIYVIYRFSNTVSFKIKMFWFNEIAFGIHSTLHFLMFTLALTLRNRYHFLNNLLKNECNSSIAIHKIEHISRILSEATTLYNSIFGWCLLFTSGKCVTHLLQWFTEILYLSSNKNFMSYAVSSASALYALVRAFEC